MTGSRIWSTDVYECVYFNKFVRKNIERDIKRRIIIKGQTGGSWQFKRFNQITIHVILDNFKTNRQMKFILKYARVDNSDDSDDDKIILEGQVSD